MINFKKYVQFLITHNLNERQFTLLYFLYIIKEDRSMLSLWKDFVKINGFPTKNNTKKLTTDEDKRQLIEQGWLEVGGPLKYRATNKFTVNFINIYSTGQQFIAAYPGFAIINNNTIPLKNSDVEIIRSLYCQRIRYSKEEHEEVLLDLEFGKLNDLIKVNIENFIRSEAWRDIRVRRLEGRSKDIYVINDNDF